MWTELQRNSFWLLFARLTAQALAILFAAILARKLGVDGFGRFAFLASLLLVGNTFTNFGTDTFLVRETARLGQVTDLASQALSLQLALSALYCAVMLLYRDADLLVYSIALFPLAIFSVNNALLRALHRMDLFWSLSLMNGVLQIVAALFSSDVFTLCIFLLAGQVILSAGSLLICSASLPRFNLLPLKDFHPIFKWALPFAVLTILLVLMQRLGVLTVSALLGDSAAGLFSSISRIVEGLKLGHYAILGALLPALSRGAPGSWTSFRKAFAFLLGLSFFFAIILAVFASPILLILYGPDFRQASIPLAWLGWSLLPYTVSSFISYDLIARGAEVAVAWAAFVSLFIHALLYLWLIRTDGLSGAVLAALFGECLQAAMFVLIYVNWNLRFSRPHTNGHER